MTPSAAAPSHSPAAAAAGPSDPPPAGQPSFGELAAKSLLLRSYIPPPLLEDFDSIVVAALAHAPVIP